MRREAAFLPVHGEWLVADAVTGGEPRRRLGPRLPQPDDTVLCWNAAFERQADGSWRGWLSPINPAVGQTTIEVRAPSEDGVVTAMFDAIDARLAAFGEDDAGKAAFVEAHGVRVLHRDVPSRDRSGDLDFWRTLDWWFERQDVPPQAAAIDVVDKPAE